MAHLSQKFFDNIDPVAASMLKFAIAKARRAPNKEIAESALTSGITLAALLMANSIEQRAAMFRVIRTDFKYNLPNQQRSKILFAGLPGCPSVIVGNRGKLYRNYDGVKVPLTQFAGEVDFAELPWTRMFKLGIDLSDSRLKNLAKFCLPDYIDGKNIVWISPTGHLSSIADFYTGLKLCGSELAVAVDEAYNEFICDINERSYDLVVMQSHSVGAVIASRSKKSFDSEVLHFSFAPAESLHDPRLNNLVGTELDPHYHPSCPTTVLQGTKDLLSGEVSGQPTIVTIGGLEDLDSQQVWNSTGNHYVVARFMPETASQAVVQHTQIMTSYLAMQYVKMRLEAQIPAFGKQAAV